MLFKWLNGGVIDEGADAVDINVVRLTITIFISGINLS